VALAAWLAAPATAPAAPGLLLPPNIQGEYSPDQIDALIVAFTDTVATLSGAPLDRREGAPCPVPELCLEPTVDADLYWLQLSGRPGALLGVAARLAPDGTPAARATATGDDPAAVGAELARAVAAGETDGLDVLTHRRGARVYLEGELLGRTPLHLDTPLPAGRHAIQVVHRDGATALALVQARAGERPLLELDFTGVPPGPLAQKRRRAWPLVPLLAGAATAAILVATDPANIIGPDHQITIIPP